MIHDLGKAYLTAHVCCVHCCVAFCRIALQGCPLDLDALGVGEHLASCSLHRIPKLGNALPLSAFHRSIPTTRCSTSSCCRLVHLASLKDVWFAKYVVGMIVAVAAWLVIEAFELVVADLSLVANTARRFCVESCYTSANVASIPTSCS